VGIVGAVGCGGVIVKGINIYLIARPSCGKQGCLRRAGITFKILAGPILLAGSLPFKRAPYWLVAVRMAVGLGEQYF
jgi:hypothetical protein